MAFNSVLTGDSTKHVRNERRRQEDKRRMAFRRAIEDYREAQALREQLGESAEPTAAREARLARPAV